ncbi:PREDICTED: uncharacterized protein LOC106149311 isoform X1 [Chinchilla lanigera]|uniref:uncharacterized protein LOC106149311 isoform X1 n=1 Tax=Chinchilla lanigera TaxID=34839 RepID=UPI0006961C03|nr:PREDICTED: uncharacterized protein LOC106149311 isoform X1 [Chinchilla lanigera]
MLRGCSSLHRARSEEPGSPAAGRAVLPAAYPRCSLLPPAWGTRAWKLTLILSLISWDLTFLDRPEPQFPHDPTKCSRLGKLDPQRPVVPRFGLRWGKEAGGVGEASSRCRTRSGLLGASEDSAASGIHVTCWNLVRPGWTETIGAVESIHPSVCVSVWSAHGVAVRGQGGAPLGARGRVGWPGGFLPPLLLRAVRAGRLSLSKAPERPIALAGKPGPVPRQHHGSSQGLQMPIGIPIALGVLALLALLALACNCLTEAWKSKWRPCCQRWWHLHPGNDQQLVSLKSPRMRGS